MFVIRTSFLYIRTEIFKIPILSKPSSINDSEIISNHKTTPLSSQREEREVFITNGLVSDKG